MVTLKGGLRVPGIPCRRLSIGTTHRNGSEFVEPGSNQRYLQIDRNAPKVSHEESKGFLTLPASVKKGNGGKALVHASFVNKKRRLTLKESHYILGHIDPGAVKHLEKRGLIDKADITVASEMRYAVFCECESQGLSYGRAIHTELEGPFYTDVSGIEYSQVTKRHGTSVS